MRQKIAKLINKVVAHSNVAYEQRNQVTKGLKRAWLATPRNERHHVRRRFEQVLSQKARS